MSSNIEFRKSAACAELLDDAGWHGPFKQTAVGLLLATTKVRGKPAQYLLILTTDKNEFITTTEGENK